MSLANDLGSAWRQVARHPRFATLVVLVLSTGMGAGIAIFSVLNATLLRDMVYPESERLFAIENYSLKAGSPYPVKAADYLEFLRRGRFHSSLAMVRSGESANLTSKAAEPERVVAAVVSASLLHVLRVRPVLGRFFSETDERQGRVVVLTHRLFQSRFRADPGILSRTIELDGVAHQVIGVMPPRLEFPDSQTEILLPLEVPAEELRARFLHRFRVYGRLKDGTTLTQAAAEVAALGEQLRREYPVLNENIGARLRDFESDSVLRLRSALRILCGAVAALMLLICANLANLLVSRGFDRRKEFEIRIALGAPRVHLLRQCMSENLMLSTLGAFGGSLVALAILRLVLPLIPNTIPGLSEVRLDARVAAFALGLAGLTALVFGLLPAWLSSNPDALRQRGASTDPPGIRRLRGALVSLEVALTVVMLTGAGLLFQTLNRLLELELGLQSGGVLTARLALPKTKYPTPEAVTQFHGRLIRRLEQIPGAERAALVSRLPLDGTLMSGPVQVQGRTKQIVDHVDHRAVTPSYFSTVGIRLLRGRLLTDEDTPGRQHVVVIDEVAANRYFPGEEPLGKVIQPGSPLLKLPWSEIVGVVRTVRNDGPDTPSRGQVYAAIGQRTFGNDRMGIVLKAYGNPIALASELRQAVREVDPQQPVFAIQTIQQLLDRTLWHRRFLLRLTMIFAAAALIIAAIGVYSVISFAVARRTHEIGLRMALGATAMQIRRRFLLEAIGLSTVGASVGLLLSAWMGKGLASFVQAGANLDPQAVVYVVATVLAVSGVAALGPASRAARVSPVESLRSE